MRVLLLALTIANAWFHNGRATTPAAKSAVPPDTTPPETTLSGYPDNPTTSRSATFTFASDDPAATFQCNLDGAGYSSCTSPKTYAGPLTFGAHSFLVRATDAALNTDNSPASHSWTITFTNTYSTTFAGDDDIVTFGQPSNMNFTPGTSKFTVSVWFKRGAAADFDRDLVSHATQGGGGTTNFDLRVTSGDAIQSYVFGGQNTSGGDTSGFVHGWHHAVSAVSGPTGKLYLDGHQVGSDFAVGVSSATGIDWLIGASRYDSNADTGFPYSGKADELTFWDVALSASGVLELFNSGDPNAPTSHSQAAHLIHWYRMGDEDTYPSIHDEVGGVTGTCMNMASSGNIQQTDVPVGLDLLSCVAASGCEQLVSDDWDGSSSTWTAHVGTNNATKRGSPTNNWTPNFMGRKSTLLGPTGVCFTWPGDAIAPTGVRSYEILIDDWGTGNLARYVMSRHEGSFVNLAIWLYKTSSTIYESEIYKSGAGGIWIGGAHSYTANEGKPVAWTITMDLSAPRFTVYKNGVLANQATTTSGSFGTATNVAVGIGCSWNQSSVSAEYFNGKILEVLRHDGVELPSGTVLSRMSQFNNLKGY